MVGGILLLGLLVIPIVRRGFSSADSSRSSGADASHPVVTADSSGTIKHATPATWKLPFRLKPRLTEEQQRILSSGRVGAYLREHPQEVDVLVAWAADDPEAAKAWLASVGEIKVDGVGYYYGHLAALAAGIFAHGGIAEMQALLEEHRQDPLLPPKYQDGGFAAHPWFLMAREDTGQEAIAYLQEHPEKGELAGQFLAGIEDTDRMLAALDYFQAKGIDCSPNHWQLGSRTKKDGALLADWAAAAYPDLLQDILLGWNRYHPEDARKWLDAHASRPDLEPVLGKLRGLIDDPGR